VSFLTTIKFTYQHGDIMKQNTSKEQPETIDRKTQTINLMSTRKDTKPKQ
jgi:hypothetical protein